MNVVQMNAHQVQLEEAVGMMSQEIGMIKELLERLFVPQAPATTKGDNIVKSSALSSKLLRPPRMAKWPQGVARTPSTSPSQESNPPSRPYRIEIRRTLRLDHPGLTTKQYQASHRGPQHHSGRRRKSELEEGQSKRVTSLTYSARMPRKTCMFT